MTMAALSCTGFSLSSPASCSQTATHHVEYGKPSQLLVFSELKRPAGAIPRGLKLSRAYRPSLIDALSRQERTRWCSPQQLPVVSSLTSKGGADEKGDPVSGSRCGENGGTTCVDGKMNTDTELGDRRVWLGAGQLEKELQAQIVNREGEVQRVAPSGGLSLKIFTRKVVRQLSSLPLAISELFAIAGLSAIGTVIQQGESPEFYFQNFSDEHPVLGFLTWQWILGLGFDRIYTSPIFLGLLVLLAASLMACTSTTQLPIVKVARRWSFVKSLEAVSKLDINDSLPRARLSDLGTVLAAQGYEVFAKDSSLYAFKGLAGRLAPIGVHAALLCIMAGGTLSAAGGLHGTVMIPQGLNFNVREALGSSGFLGSSVPDMRVDVNKFYIDYRPTGEVGQFHSDLTIVDSTNNNEISKTISVNDPLRYEGVTMYQTDWGISAIQVRVDGSEPFNLVMAQLQKGDNKLFGTYLPLGEKGTPEGKGISILARDLQSAVIYDKDGQFVGVRRPGSKKPIQVDNVSIVVDDLIGSTGLEVKMDPGVPLVYTGFGGLMFTTTISYLSHSQVWALQDGTWLIVGGKSNRAKYEFERELNELLDLVPEIQSGNQTNVVTEPCYKETDLVA